MPRKGTLTCIKPKATVPLWLYVATVFAFVPLFIGGVVLLDKANIKAAFTTKESVRVREAGWCQGYFVAQLAAMSGSADMKRQTLAAAIAVSDEITTREKNIVGAMLAAIDTYVVPAADAGFKDIDSDIEFNCRDGALVEPGAGR